MPCPASGRLAAWTDAQALGPCVRAVWPVRADVARACLAPQGLDVNPLAAYHVQQAVKLGARASVMLTARGCCDGVERTLQLQLHPIRPEEPRAATSLMLGVLREAAASSDHA